MTDQVATASRSERMMIGVGLGLLLAAMGAFFTFALWRGYERAMETRSWTEVECVIIKSEITQARPTPNSSVAYSVDIEYEYRFDGTSYTGTRLKRVDGPTNKREKAGERATEFRPGMTVPCWVNPEDPSFAVLKHGTKAAGYSMWFPALIAVGGLGIAVGSLFRR